MQTIEDDSNPQFPWDMFHLLTNCQPVVDYINSCDLILYQSIVDFLIPDVFKPIPKTLLQAIRKFSKSLNPWLSTCLQGYSSNLVQIKVY